MVPAPPEPAVAVADTVAPLQTDPTEGEGVKVPGCGIAPTTISLLAVTVPQLMPLVASHLKVVEAVKFPGEYEFDVLRTVDSPFLFHAYVKLPLPPVAEIDRDPAFCPLLIGVFPPLMLAVSTGYTFTSKEGVEGVHTLLVTVHEKLVLAVKFPVV
jgi:hypothetical protein